jgi:predicted secreted protein
VNQSIRVRAGETFDVPLKGSAGTGYRWEVVVPPAAAQLLALSNETRDTTTVPGGPTVQHFHFQALAPGTLDLTFRYRRSWEAPDSGETHVVTVQIDPRA